MALRLKAASKRLNPMEWNGHPVPVTYPENVAILGPCVKVAADDE
jgi:hypothetical protein